MKSLDRQPARRSAAGERMVRTMNLSWKQLGRCRGVDPEIFYPVNEDDATEAKEICVLCPVREPCLEHALGHREKHGVWGGLTERERRRVLRRRRKTA